MSARRRCSHFFLFPFFFFLLFLDFLRPPGITGLIAGGLVGEGAGTSAVAAAGAGASAVAAAGAGTFGSVSACGGIACLMSCLSTGVGGAPKASAATAAGISAGAAARRWTASRKGKQERKQIDWRSRAAFVRLRLTIVLSAPRGFALILSLAAQSAKSWVAKKAS